MDDKMTFYEETKAGMELWIVFAFMGILSLYMYIHILMANNLLVLYRWLTSSQYK